MRVRRLLLHLYPVLPIANIAIGGVELDPIWPVSLLFEGDANTIRIKCMTHRTEKYQVLSFMGTDGRADLQWDVYYSRSIGLSCSST